MTSELTISEIITICRGKLLQACPEQSISSLLTDSRKVSNARSAIFFAIKGSNHDGHDHIKELFQKGVRNFIVEEAPDTQLPGKANVILVASSLKALQQLATARREGFHKPVVAITGSNGKTIVKEWLSKMLSTKVNVVKSPKSYNSQLGVPLSVWETGPQYDMAVFEAGISRMGEMARLQEIIQPTHGILTNIGTAHEEGFESIGIKLQEKLRLFHGCKTLVYSTNDPLVAETVSAMSQPPENLISWAFDNPADISIDRLKNQEYSFRSAENTRVFRFPFTDEASEENLIHCICLLLELGFSSVDVQSALDKLEPVDMRLKLIKGIQDTYIIDDSYNNDLAGVESALDFLTHQNQFDRKVVVLSDMLQVSDAANVYERINALLLEKGVEKLIGVGPEMSKNSGVFSIAKHIYPNTPALLADLPHRNLSESVVLIKGARKFGFEQVVAALAEKAHQTILEINLDAITHNLNFYRNQLAPDTRIMVMVKAFAYGSGSAEVAQLLQFHKVHYLAVAYADEGVTLRQNGIHLPIMVMNTSHADLDKLIQYDLEPEIFELNQLSTFERYYSGKSTQLPVHINFNTGMNRLGFEPEEVDILLDFLNEHPDILVKSVFTHLAGADEALHNDFSLNQLKSFQPLALKIAQQAGDDVLIHALNSAGIVRFPEYQMDMVRLGIGLYGLEASGQQDHELQTVGTLKTTVSQVKEIKAGQTVGYSRKGVAEKDISIATVAIGYADGYARAFGNGKGIMHIQGQPAPVIGNVCMDMTMLDVTGLSVKPGDEVIVFGEAPSIKTLAEQASTIPYEILTNVSERVKRVYLTE